MNICQFSLGKFHDYSLHCVLIQKKERCRFHNAMSSRYIMTSEHTQEATRQFFQKHDYFGLNPDDVTFFEQFTLPCMTFEGKIILETPYKLARAPGEL